MDEQESDGDYNFRIDGEIRDLAERISRVEEENKHQSKTLEDVADAVKRIDNKLDEMRHRTVTVEELAEVEVDIESLEEETRSLDDGLDKRIKHESLHSFIKYGVTIATGSTGALLLRHFLF